jgi:hypothetical protein
LPSKYINPSTTTKERKEKERVERKREKKRKKKEKEKKGMLVFCSLCLQVIKMTSL